MPASGKLRYHYHQVCQLVGFLVSGWQDGWYGYLTQWFHLWVLSVFMVWSLPLAPVSHIWRDWELHQESTTLLSMLPKVTNTRGHLGKSMYMKSIKKSMTPCWNTTMDPYQLMGPPSHSVTPVTSVTHANCRWWDPKWQLGWGAVSYSSLSITQVKIYSSSYLIKRWFQLLNFYLNLTRKKKFTIIMDFCQVELSQNENN